MTERKSAIDPLVEFLVYAPLGAALVAQEELPKLIAKGRERVGGQVAVARFMSQMAVRQGRTEADRVIRQVEGLLSDLGVVPGRKTSGTDTAEDGPAGHPPAPARSAEPADTSPKEQDRPPVERGGTPRRQAATGIRHHQVSNGADPAVEEPMVRPSASRARSRSGGSGPSSESLAIPGYDSLSASQVLPRLSGLTAEELDAVRRYEVANRGRRTILSKVAQLQNDATA